MSRPGGWQDQPGRPGTPDQNAFPGGSGYPANPSTPGAPVGPVGAGAPGGPAGPGAPAQAGAGSGGSSDFVAAAITGVLAIFVALAAFLPVNTTILSMFGVEVKVTQNGWNNVSSELTGSFDMGEIDPFEGLEDYGSGLGSDPGSDPFSDLESELESESFGDLDSYGGSDSFDSSEFGFGSHGSPAPSFVPVQQDPYSDDFGEDSLEGFTDGLNQQLEQEMQQYQDQMETELEQSLEEESGVGAGIVAMILIVLALIAAAVLWALRLRLAAAIVTIVSGVALAGYYVFLMVGTKASIEADLSEITTDTGGMDYTYDLNLGAWLMLLLAVAAIAWGVISLLAWPGALKKKSHAAATAQPGPGGAPFGGGQPDQPGQPGRPGPGGAPFGGQPGGFPAGGPQPGGNPGWAGGSPPDGPQGWSGRP